MKYLIIFLITGLLLAGCAAMEEAYYVDREHGIAATDAFDRQIIYKDYRYAGGTVEGLPALHAEPVMGKYHGTFSQGFTKESIDIDDVGANTSGEED